jgi:hypothetical protein
VAELVYVTVAEKAALVEFLAVEIGERHVKTVHPDAGEGVEHVEGFVCFRRHRCIPPWFLFDFLEYSEGSPVGKGFPVPQHRPQKTTGLFLPYPARFAKVALIWSQRQPRTGGRSPAAFADQVFEGEVIPKRKRMTLTEGA